MIRNNLRILRDRLIGTPLTRAITSEIKRIGITEAGVDESGHPFLQIQDRDRVFGPPPPPLPHRRYDALPKSIRDFLPAECFQLAIDFVCRYQYPHAMVDATPPWSISQRAFMHPQHRDTVADIPGLSRYQRDELSERFRIRVSDVILDIGAYLGLGALRLARTVGISGLVVSAEANAANQQLYERNVFDNGANNARLVRAAVWNEIGEMDLSRDNNQQNSLVKGIIKEQSTEIVATTTVDQISSDLELPKVSLISLTINGAEVEAMDGMVDTLASFSPLLTIAGWYERDAIAIHSLLVEKLKRQNYEWIVGPVGRVYAWKA